MNNRRSEPRIGGNRNFAGRDSVSRDDNTSTGYNNRNSERDTRDFSSVDRGKSCAFCVSIDSNFLSFTAESQSSNEGFNNRRRRRQKNPPSNSESLYSFHVLNFSTFYLVFNQQTAPVHTIAMKVEVNNTRKPQTILNRHTNR